MVVRMVVVLLVRMVVVLVWQGGGVTGSCRDIVAVGTMVAIVVVVVAMWHGSGD